MKWSKFRWRSRPPQTLQIDPHWRSAGWTGVAASCRHDTCDVFRHRARGGGFQPPCHQQPMNDRAHNDLVGTSCRTAASSRLPAPRFPLPARCSLLASRAKKEPRTFFRRCGAYTWRRPTLTGPIVPLPLALQRFTSGFGMGPGGSTALWSPEGNIEVHEAAAVQFKTGALGTGLGCRVRSAERQVEELLLTFHFSLFTARLAPGWPLPDIHMEFDNF